MFFVYRAYSQKMSSEDDSLSIITYEGRKYNLCKVPPKDSRIVEDETQNITAQLKLKDLGNDLSRLGKFVRLAYCGVVGHVDLQIEVRKTLKNVAVLCDDTVHTLNEFKRSSQDALESMQSAYDYLEDGFEDEALEIFADLQQISQNMSKASNDLYQRCKAESESIQEVGNTTLLKKDAVEGEKRETEALLSSNKTEKKANEMEVKDTSDAVSEGKQEISKASESEDKIFEEKSELNSQQQKELEDENRKYKQQVAQLQSMLDSKLEKLSEELKRKEQNLQVALQKSNDHLTRKTKEIEEIWKSKIKSAEEEYNRRIKSNESMMIDALKQNDKNFENQIIENKVVCNRAIEEADRSYNNVMKQISNAYDTAIKNNKTELERKLRVASETLETTLKSTEDHYDAELQGWNHTFGIGASEVEQERAKEYSKAKQEKTNKEDRYYLDKSKADESAYSTRSKKESDEETSRKTAIDQANDTKRDDDIKASNRRETANKKAREEREKADEKAKLEKSEALRNAINEKNIAESEAAKMKENSDTAAKAILGEEDNKINKEKNEISQKYQDYLRQAKEETEKVEERIRNKYKQKSEELGERLEFLEKRKKSHKSEVDELQKKREEAYRKVLEFTKKIAENKDNIEVKETSLICLHEAVAALNSIGDIMSNAGSFWKEVEGVCNQVTHHRLSKQVSSIKDKDESLRKSIWKSKAFKKQALRFYGKWVALKDTCATAGKFITFAQDEIHLYARENPTREEAIRLIKEIAPALERDISSNKCLMDKPSD